MVYELVPVQLLGSNNDGDPISFTCASGTAIAKGTLVKLSDPMTVAAHSAVTDMIAGVAAMDKANNDYSTTISVWTNGIFEAKASGAIVLGGWVGPGAVGNTVSAAQIINQVSSGANIIGTCYETAGADETVRIRLRT